jgi:(1->4)-alpha-D-glucan 1-alpha-D-glucosylmutase
VWDLSLVDPDNRRPVDYERIKGLLSRLDSDDKLALADELLAKRDDGRIKLYVLRTALHLRREHPDLFLSAPYGTIVVAGEKREHVCAFTRVWDGVGVLVVAPRLVAGLAGGELIAPMGDVWGDTMLDLREYAGVQAHSLFTGETVTLGGSVKLADVLGRFPVGLCAFSAAGV